MTHAVRLVLIIAPAYVGACSTGTHGTPCYSTADGHMTAHDEFRTGPNYPLFTVRRDGTTYTGTAVQARNAHYYYCIDRDGAPWKIVELPPFQWENVPFVYRGDLSSKDVPVPFSPVERLEQALASPRRAPEMLNELRAAHREGNWGVVPAFIITLPLELATAGLREEQRLKRQQQADRFDLARVQLGMTSDEVDGIYGEPRIVARDGEQHVRVYGEPSDWSSPQGPEFLFAHVAVYFDDGRVSALYANDFLHKEYFDRLRR